MSSYINVFGGNTVQTSDDSYLAIALTQNITLSWPTEFQNINNSVAYTMDVTPDAGGRTLTLPDATNTSVGKEFTVNNPGGFNFDLLMNGGGLLSTINAGTSTKFYLTNNTTAAGTWGNIPNGGGAVAVTNVNATVPNATDNANLQIAGAPITGAGTLQFSFANDLRALISFVAGTGFSVRTAANTWALRSIAAAPNANITIQNGNGVAGNVIIDLAQIIGVAPQTAITQARVGNINIQANTISVVDLNGNITITPNGTGETLTDHNIRLRSGALLKFFNAANNGSISLSGTNIGAFTLDLTWPAALPIAGQVLQYNGAGPPNLSWATVATLPGGVSTDNAIARYDGTGGQLQNSGVTIDDTNNVLCLGNITSNTSFISGQVFLSATNQTLGTNANTNLNLSPNGTGFVQVNSDIRIGTNAVGGRKTLFFPQPSNFAVSLIAPLVLAGNVALTLPNTVGAAGALLQSDGAGVLTFTDVAGAGNQTSGVVSLTADMVVPVSTVKPVVPAYFAKHDGVIKSEATFAGATGVVAFSYNVNGAINRAAAGQYTATFTTAMANTNYGVTLSCDRAATFLNYTNKTVNGFDIRAFDQTGGVAVDPGEISFTCFGRQ